MKQEKVILSFIMVLIGLLVSGVAFYFYQTGKQTNKTQQTIISPTPSSADIKAGNLLLEVTNPKDESIVENKILELSGKTNPQATIIIITKSDQQILKPSSSGKFTTNLTLNKDQNLITVISLLPSGESIKVQNTVTYTTSDF